MFDQALKEQEEQNRSSAEQDQTQVVFQQFANQLYNQLEPVQQQEIQNMAEEQ